MNVAEKYDIAVIGGGIGGLCTAIAAARHGAKTVLIQDRPVLGGNASSEVKMHICGASCHGKFPNRRETGIIEEILLENKHRNPEHSYALFDTLLWGKAMFQENLTLHLNTYMTEVDASNNTIHKIKAVQLTTEKMYEIEAKIFVDATGDGTLSYLAGAEFMYGREDKCTFGENNAVAKGDSVTMGNSIMFKAVDAGHPVSFEKPFWAHDYKNSEWVKRIKWVEITSGYWWLELGGTELNVISDAEETKDELLKIIYGIWDYIKNTGDERATNLVLDWVGMIPAKRESRRIVGDYILTENDLENSVSFEDTVAYGGWHVDAHPPERFLNHTVKGIEPTEDKTRWLDDIYEIPYRCLYSKNIENLMLAGRLISVSHRAFASTRVMGTCAVCGQAVGTAAALAIHNNILPREVGNKIKELQQILLKDDCYLPNVVNSDETDIARTSKISCSDENQGYECGNVVKSITRCKDNQSNMWATKVCNQPWIKLELAKKEKIKEIRLVFDSDLSTEIMPSVSKWVQDKQSKNVPDTLVRDYKIECLEKDKKVYEETVKNNYQRLRVHLLNEVMCDTVKITVNATNGCEEARIFEIRAY